MFGPRMYDARLRDTISWIRYVIRPDETIAVRWRGEDRRFRFDFPLYPGAMPKVIRFRDGDRQPAFVIRDDDTPMPEDAWLRVFSSPVFSVWERRGRHVGDLPLRFGLDLSERELLVAVARASLGHVAEERRSPAFDQTALPRRLLFKTDVGVALWAGGHLRGSVIMEGRGLGEGVREAAARAAADPRFKPVGAAELDALSIEITVIGDLRVPLSAAEIRAGEIYPDKGYRLVSGDRAGWFLPEVFNAVRFGNLADFLEALAREKAGVERFEPSATVSLFEVEDFIALPGADSPLSLYGPIVRKKSDSIQRTDFAAMGHAAARWLLRVQEEDGTIPPILNPSRELPPRVDWPRLAFTAWALAEFGRAAGEREYIDAAARAFSFLHEHMFVRNAVVSHRPLALAYLGELARVLGKDDMSASIVGALASLDSASADIITLSQAASFLQTTDGEAPPAALMQELRDRFARARRSPGHVDLASYAELANTFAVSDPGFSQAVSDWLASLQRPDGSFPRAPGSSFSYSRGTGKIFEVLALDPKRYRESIARAASWLADMQYDDANLFFVAPDRREKLLGAFRHDAQNPDAWIDAAGHVLLGISRILNAPHLS